MAPGRALSMPSPEPIPAEKLDDSDDVKGPRFLDLREFILVCLGLNLGALWPLGTLRGPTARASRVVAHGLTAPR